MDQVDDSNYIFNHAFYLPEYLQYIKPILQETFQSIWLAIPFYEREIIICNLEIVICKNIQEHGLVHNSGGITMSVLFDKCMIILNSKYFDSTDSSYQSMMPETKRYFMAHELAHAYFNHPKEMMAFQRDLDCKIDISEEIKSFAIKRKCIKGEIEANDLADKWGIMPNSNDCKSWKNYNAWRKLRGKKI